MQGLKQTSLTLVAVALLALCATAASAASFTLAQLVSGGGVTSFDSDDGLLTFSDFKVTKTKKLSGNLSLYTVTVLADGFSLSSPEFTANGGGLRKLDLSYTVTAKAGTITGAQMAMDASRSSGRVKVEKDIEDPLSDEGTFLLTLLRDNASILSDADTFTTGAASFEVEEAVRIKKVSQINSISNTYTVVPEPQTLSLLGLGIAGLIWTGRRRSHSA